MSAPDSPDVLDWAVLLKNAKVVDPSAVRAMNAAHRALFTFKGPPNIGAFVRLFRLTGLFAHLAMADKRFPVLNRAWDDLRWIMAHPEADEFAATSWLYLDLPVTDDGRTVAEVFAAEIAPDNAGLRTFVEATRRSRYGLYVDSGGTNSSHRVVELVSRKRETVRRGVVTDPGELIWTRIIDWGGERFMLGDTRGWPPAYRDDILANLLNRLSGPHWRQGDAPVEALYDRFMRLSGPYWLSMLYAQSDLDPLFDPEHYLEYQAGSVPDFAPARRVSVGALR